MHGAVAGAADDAGGRGGYVSLFWSSQIGRSEKKEAGVRFNVLAAALLFSVEACGEVARPAAACCHHRGFECRGFQVLGLDLWGFGTVDDVAGAASAGGLEL